MRVIDAGLLEEDIARVIQTPGLHPTAISYTTLLHTPNETFELPLLSQVEILRDYRNNVGDHTIVSFTMGMGDYVKGVIPYNNDLEMTLIFNYYDDEYPLRYNAVISSNLSGVSGSVYGGLTRVELNEAEMVSVELQLTHPLLDILRVIDINGIHNYTDVGTVIKAELLDTVKQVKIDGKTPTIDINMVPANNQQTYRHVEIPYGTNILDLPSYLQNQHYGVYNTGIGTYLQNFNLTTDKEVKPTVFVYPLHNTQQFDNPVRKLLILSTPSFIYDNMDNTFLLDGDNLTIIGAGSVKDNDDGSNRIRDQGGGLLLTNSDSVLGVKKQVTNSTLINDPTRNVNGVNAIPNEGSITKRTIVNNTSNSYRYVSEVTSRDVSLYQIIWRFSNPELLYPGMPVAYVIDDSELGVVRLTGTLQLSYTKWDKTTGTISTLLNVLLTKPKNIDNSNVTDLRQG